MIARIPRRKLAKTDILIIGNISLSLILLFILIFPIISKLFVDAKSKQLFMNSLTHILSDNDLIPIKDNTVHPQYPIVIGALGTICALCPSGQHIEWLTNQNEMNRPFTAILVVGSKYTNRDINNIRCIWKFNGPILTASDSLLHQLPRGIGFVVYRRNGNKPKLYYTLEQIKEVLQ